MTALAKSKKELEERALKRCVMAECLEYTEQYRAAFMMDTVHASRQFSSPYIPTRANRKVGVARTAGIAKVYKIYRNVKLAIEMFKAPG